MKRSHHYVAQQIKLLVDQLDRKVLYPLANNDNKELWASLMDYETSVKSLSKVLKIHKNTIHRLVYRVLMRNTWWIATYPFTEEDLEVAQQEHEESLEYINHCEDIYDLIRVVWEDDLPYGRIYNTPATRDVMNMLA